MSSIPRNNTISMLNFMESLWDFQKLMKFIYYVISLDVLLAFFTGHGLFYLTFTNKLEFTFGDIIGFVLIFGIFSSFFLGFISLFFSLFLIRVKYKFKLLDDSNEIKRRDYGCVSLYELWDEACKEQSDFIYKIYAKENERRKEKESKADKTELISVGLFLLIVTEWFLSSPDGSTQLFIDWLWTMLKQHDESLTHFGVGFLCVGILACYAVTVCWPRERRHMVYFLPLYLKLEKLRANELKERQKWESN